jgi:MFS family permease
MTAGNINRPTGKAHKLYYGYIMVGITFLIMFVSWGLYIVFGVFFDRLLTEFGWSRAAISGAYSLSSIISGVLGIIVGGLTDRIGPRLVVTVSGCILGLGYILMSQVNSLWQLYLFYGVIIGTGMSGLWIPLLSPIVRWFTDKRSLMTGIIISGLTIGQLTAPLGISRLIAAHGWRMSYTILGGAAIVLIVLLAQFLKPNPDRSAILVSRENDKEKQGPLVNSKDFNLEQAARTLQFWLVAAIFFCLGYIAFSITVHIVPHAIKLGIPDITAANILAINGGVGILGNFVLGGIIGDRIGNRKVFIIGLVLMTAPLVWLIPAKELWLLYLFAVIFGIGIGGAGTSESPLIARLFGLSSHGLIYGVVGLSWTLGAALGPFVTGYLCDILGNYQVAFFICALMGVLGVLLLIILKPMKKRGIPI